MVLKPRWRKLLLVVHVAATVGWLGAELVLLAFGVAALRGAEPMTVYPAASLLGVWVVAPLTALALATGLLQGWLTRWGLFRHWWVTVKLGLTAVMSVLVPVALLPGLAKAAEMAAAGVDLARRDQINLVVAPSVANAMLLTALVLSVYKPFGRVGRSRRA